MKKMNPVVHFEMPAEDTVRMANFYTNAFGWQTKSWGEEMGNYVTATTTETGENGRPSTPGAINGGFYPKAASQATASPSIVIAVDDIRQSMKDVTAAGGKVLGEPVEIPGVGMYVSFLDTEGNRCSILQPSGQPSPM
jgi:predicted enzyme related to lactoylglutathione lyase